MASGNLPTPLRLNEILQNIQDDSVDRLLMKCQLLEHICSAMAFHFAFLIQDPNCDRFELNDLVRTDFVRRIRRSPQPLLKEITEEGLLLLRQHITDMESGPFEAAQTPTRSPQPSIPSGSVHLADLSSLRSNIPERDTASQRSSRHRPMLQASAIQIPKFSGKSLDWKLFQTSLLAYFMAHGLDRNLLTDSDDQIIDPEDNSDFWIILVTALQGSEVAQHCIEFPQDGKGLYTHLLLKFEKRGIVHTHHLFRKFTNTALNSTDDPSNFIRNMKNVRNELSHVNQHFTDQVFIGELIYALPDNYDSVKTRLLENETNDIDTYTRLVMGHYNILLDKGKSKLAANKPTLVRQPHSQSDKYASQPKSKHHSSKDFKSDRPYCKYHKSHGHSTEECREKPKPSANLTQSCTEPPQVFHHFSASTKSKRFKNNTSRIILDSGASTHFIDPDSKFAKRHLTIEYLTKDTSEVTVAGGSTHQSTGTANCTFKTLDNNGQPFDIYIKDALIVPKFGNNLLSMAKFCTNGIHVNTEFLLLYKDQLKVPLLWDDNLLKMTAVVNTTQSSANNVISNINAATWHKRLGHPSFFYMQKLRDDPLSKVKFTDTTLPDCLICRLCKGKRLPHSKKASRSNEILERVHIDLTGKIPKSYNGYSYAMVITDDFSRFRKLYLLKKKDQVLKSLQDYIECFSKYFDKTVRSIRTDNAGELISDETRQYIESKRIHLELSAPHAHQQNGVAERTFGQLNNIVRTLLEESQCPKTLWSEAFHHAVHLLNRIPTSANEFKTPYEVFHSKKPSHKFLQTFGTKAYALSEKFTRNHKFDPTSFEGLYVGFSENHANNTYRIYNPKTKCVTLNCNVTFSTEPVSKKDISDYDTARSDSLLLPSDTKHSESLLLPSERIDTIAPSKYNDHFMTTRSKCNKKTQSLDNPDKLQAYLTTDEFLQTIDMLEPKTPFTVGQALAEDRLQQNSSWRNAIIKENESLRKNKVGTLVKIPPNTKVLDTRYIFKIKRDINGNIIKHKARYVVKGYLQKKDVDYTHTYSPTASSSSTRTLIAIAAYH